MAATQLPLLTQMKARLDWLDQRQRVLAQNIANADTPGYRPSDLKPFDTEQSAGHGPFAVMLRQTNADHLPTPTGSSRNPEEVKVRRTFEVAPAGNAVDLEEEMAKVGENTITHNTTTALYRKYIGMIKTALNAKD